MSRPCICQWLSVQGALQWLAGHPHGRIWSVNLFPKVQAQEKITHWTSTGAQIWSSQVVHIVNCFLLLMFCLKRNEAAYECICAIRSLSVRLMTVNGLQVGGFTLAAWLSSGCHRSHRGGRMQMLEAPSLRSIPGLWWEDPGPAQISRGWWPVWKGCRTCIKWSAIRYRLAASFWVRGDSALRCFAAGLL